jgi:hypothetical protein
MGNGAKQFRPSSDKKEIVMATTQGDARSDPDYRPNVYRGRRERGIFISTEARPGFITSEFWLTIVGVTALGILAFASDALGVRYGLGFAAAVLLGYVVSRGFAKAGSSESLSSRGGRDDDTH